MLYDKMIIMRKNASLDWKVGGHCSKIRVEIMYGRWGPVCCLPKFILLLTKIAKPFCLRIVSLSRDNIDCAIDLSLMHLRACFTSTPSFQKRGLLSGRFLDSILSSTCQKFLIKHICGPIPKHHGQHGMVMSPFRSRTTLRTALALHSTHRPA